MNTLTPRLPLVLPPGREEALVMQAQSGDTNAFSELARVYSPRLLRTALRVVRNPADAEDVVQESLWSAFRHLGSFRYQAAFSTWLTRITVNQGLVFLRRQPPESEIFKIGDLPVRRPSLGATPPQGRTPEDICMSNKFELLLWQSIQRIRPRREVPLFRAFAKLSHSEIARQLHISVNTAKMRMHRGRAELRNHLIKSLGQPHYAGPLAITQDARPLATRSANKTDR